MENDINRLKQLNEDTLPPPNKPLAMNNEADQQAMNVDVSHEEQMDVDNNCVDSSGVALDNLNWPQPVQPPSFPAPPTRLEMNIAPRPVPVVGRVQIGIVAPPESAGPLKQKKKGERGGNKRKRRERHCRLCKTFSTGDKETAHQQVKNCPGRNGNGGPDACQHFYRDGKKRIETLVVQIMKP